MAKFDPDAFLASPSGGKDFNPDAFLKGTPAKSSAQSAPSKTAAPAPDFSKQKQNIHHEETIYDPVTGLPLSSGIGEGPTGGYKTVQNIANTAAAIPIQVATGYTAPVVGATQIASRVVGSPIGDDAARAFRQIETGTQQSGGDWGGKVLQVANLGGAVANPLGQRTLLSPNFLTRGAAGGILGVLQPTDPSLTNDQFIDEKMKQAGIGATLGVAVPPVLNKTLNVTGNVANAVRESRVGQMAQELLRDKFPKVFPRESSLSGVGSASVSSANKLMNEAESLPVPITLSKGQATRESSLLLKEDDLMKSFPNEARILTKQRADQQQKILDNFDSLADDIGTRGATAGGDVYATGNSIKASIEAGEKLSMENYSNLYTKARQEAASLEPVSLEPVVKFIKEQTPTTRKKLAPILNAVEEQIHKISPDGKVPLAQTEDLIQLVNKVTGGASDANAKFGREIKELIDKQTAGKGGEYFKAAREARRLHADEFENSKIVSQLIDNLGGYSKTARVNPEGVFNFVIKQGKDDIQRLMGQLSKYPEGAQAIANLQQQLILHLKNEVSKGATRTIEGAPFISPAKFSKLIDDLDKSGKLNLILGNKTSEVLRTLRNVTKNVNEGAKEQNWSGTAGGQVRAAQLLDKLGFIPFAKNAAEALRSNRAITEARSLAAFDRKDLAKELRALRRKERGDIDYLERFRGQQ